MFTAMRRPPVVWLLVLLALFGGWLAYDWHRGVPDGLLASKDGASRTVADAPPPVLEQAGRAVVEQAEQTRQSAAAPLPQQVPEAKSRAPDDQVSDQAADQPAGSTVSVAVRLWFPAVCHVTWKLCAPLSVEV